MNIHLNWMIGFYSNFIRPGWWDLLGPDLWRDHDRYWPGNHSEWIGRRVHDHWTDIILWCRRIWFLAPENEREWHCTTRWNRIKYLYFGFGNNDNSDLDNAYIKFVEAFELITINKTITLDPIKRKTLVDLYIIIPNILSTHEDAQEELDEVLKPLYKRKKDILKIEPSNLILQLPSGLLIIGSAFSFFTFTHENRAFAIFLFGSWMKIWSVLLS